MGKTLEAYDWEPTRKKHVEHKMASCRHFNGFQNKQCRAGTTYTEATNTHCMPCIPKSQNGRTLYICESFSLMTREEAEAESHEWIALVKRNTAARIIAKDDAKAKGLGKGHGGYGSVACSACGTGTLRYNVASYNGHMHGKCSTPGCVSWME